MSTFDLSATVGSSMQSELDRSFDTEAERQAYFEGLQDGVGWSELRSWDREDPDRPGAVVVSLTPEQSDYVQSLAKKNGVSFDDYAASLFDKGLHADKQAGLIE